MTPFFAVSYFLKTATASCNDSNSCSFKANFLKRSSSDQKPNQLTQRLGLVIPVGPPGKAGPPVPLSKGVFQKYDADKSGSISFSEFRDLCTEFGYLLSEEELNIAVKKLDTNGDGHLSYDEFVKFWSDDDRFKKLALNEQELESLQEAVAVFKKYDTGKKGIISSGDFPALHQHLVANNMTKLSCQDCMKDLDTDRNQEISFNEYVQWIVKIGATKVKLVGL